MPAMYSFGFWFSVRLGSIFVAVISLVEAVLGITACGLGLRNEYEVSHQMSLWLSSNDMLLMTGVLTNIRDDPESYLVAFMTFLVIYAVSCLILIYGALKCNLYMVYPFVVLDLARLLFLTVNFIIAMLLVKENIYNLGLLIGCSVVGGFVLLFLYYLWFCTVSLCQIVKEVEKMQNPASNPLRPDVSQPEYIGKHSRVGLGYYNNDYEPIAKPVY